MNKNQIKIDEYLVQFMPLEAVNHEPIITVIDPAESAYFTIMDFGIDITRVDINTIVDDYRN